MGDSAAWIAAWAVLAVSAIALPAAGGPVPDPVAVVNGENISADAWVRRMQSLRAPDFVISANPIRMKASNAGQVALESLINARLLIQYAARTSLLPPDAQVEAELQAQKKVPAIAQALERKLMTEDQLRDTIRANQALYNVVTINVAVTDDEVKAYYDKHPEFFGTPERWQLSTIRTESAADAAKVIATVKGGKSFAAVASEMSTDPEMRARGGDIGTMVAGDMRLPEVVRNAVAKLQVGEMTPPLAVPQDGGRTLFYVVRLTARQPAVIQPFDEVKERARHGCLFEKAGGTACAEKKVEAFRKASQIEVRIPEYSDLYAEKPVK